MDDVRHTEEPHRRSLPRLPSIPGEGRRASLAGRKQRFEQSFFGEVCRRLTDLAFIDQAMLLAGILVVWLIPALIVLDGVRGRSVVEAVSSRMGLNDEASALLAGLFRPAPPSGVVTASAALVVAVGMIGAAAAIQRLYQLVFELESRGARDRWRQAAWVGVTAVGISATRLLGGELNGLPAGPLLAGLASFLLIAVYFWWGMHFLLAGRIGWGELLPGAVFTALCWIGLGVFSRFYFSSAIIANNREYGPIGIVFILMTWLLAVGVVLILGPVTGAAWSNARARRASAR
jgi:membrane protein